MKKLLYIGNFLHTSGKTPPPAVLLLEELSQFFDIRIASRCSNPALRFLHMLFAVVKGKFAGAKLIIVDVFSSKAFWFAVVVSELSSFINLKLVLVLHGGQLPERFRKSPVLSKRLFKLAHRVVSPSAYLKHHAEQIPGVQVQVIGNPLQLDQYPFVQKSYECIHLLWVRSFHAIYQPAMAVAVVKELKHSFPNVQLTMIGPDKDGSMERIKQLVQLEKLEENIHIKGLMSKVDWIQESKKANIFINTTTADNTPVSVLEALALGFPVVSTNVGGIPFLLEHEKTALLVDNGDVNAMIQAIIRIMQESDLREKLIQDGRELAEEMQLGKIVGQWKLLIDEVVS
jgi:glycosyltransferase involved in cell wall biosynthesis